MNDRTLPGFSPGNLHLLKAYDYDLPPALIAQEPLPLRDQSRLMILEPGAALCHLTFTSFPELLRPGDLLVLNDTRVIPARLRGRIAGRESTAELLLLHRSENGLWTVMARPGRKLLPGARVFLDGGVEAVVKDFAGKGLRLVQFHSPRPFEEMLPLIGAVPLPPYISRQLNDPCRYQTIYAGPGGSAAAPTAGFHFTENIFQALQEREVTVTSVTLHIGPGTFQPVKTDDIRRHSMHGERYLLPAETAVKLNETRHRGGRVIAVGTTVCRVLETLAREDGSFPDSAEGWTDLYIYPGYTFRAVDALLTNFHLPRSTLLMMITAFGGYERVMAAYREAVQRRYRFFSFGDCMFLHRQPPTGGVS